LGYWRSCYEWARRQNVTDIAAQISLYPLRQTSLSSPIGDALRIFREHGLDVMPGAMSSLLSGDDSAVFSALHEAFRRAAEQGEVVMVVTFSNACPAPPKQGESISYSAIGHVENDFDKPAAPERIRTTESRISLDPALAEGLEGLTPGQQIMVVFHLHRSHGFDLLQHPRGDRNRPRRGLFTLRSPRRPNPIGITVVDLIAVEENMLRVRGLDAINGTPVLDLKPA
jgi:tRNA-Thr(GGU) m(6)t(6)A37 methyltransferase TsaA